MDITARKRAEDELRTLSRALEQSPTSIVITDRVGNIEYVNPRFEQVTGYTKTEVFGKNPRILKSGSTPPETYAELWKVISEGGEWRGELCNRRKNGDLYWEFAAISGLKNEDGVIAHFIAVKEEITDRKRAEQERIKLEDQLHQAQKMESIGRLAGGVAHDFNNMLSVILGHTEMALEDVDPTLSLHEDILEIREAARRSADLTRQLLAFARKQTIAPKVLDLSETVAGMLKMLQRVLGENVKIDWRPGEAVWPVKIDPSQVDQILANLCVNARDAISGVGKLTIETGNATFDEQDHIANRSVWAGEYVYLGVSDNGCGMDADTLAHIFEPFFTTKEMGKGTGLGLATVYGIVKQNQGFINVYSEPGLGTNFTVYLPRHRANIDPARPTLALPALRGHETILLVEDEPIVLKVTRRMLEGLGYRVVAATSSGEAIRLAKQTVDLHLLITDIVMPEMNGRDLAKSLLPLYPRLKVLFLSGYTADVIALHGVVEDGVGFVQKPFSKEMLATKVRAVLDETPEPE